VTTSLQVCVGVPPSKRKSTQPAGSVVDAASTAKSYENQPVPAEGTRSGPTNQAP
jgi:hypothetical protein